MNEFLIRRTDGEWFDLHQSKFSETLRPITFPCEPVTGSGDYRIKIEGCEVSFSYEDPGIQICFEGAGVPDDVARKIVDEIAANIAKTTGQGARVIEL